MSRKAARATELPLTTVGVPKAITTRKEQSSSMFRSAYLLWKRNYSRGGVRFIIFVTMGITISLALLVLGIAYFTGLLRGPGRGLESNRSVGVGMCVAATVSILSFLLAVRSSARQYAKQDDREARLR
jgi:hypothetical protein